MKHTKSYLMLFLIGLVFSIGVPDTVYALIAGDNSSFNLNYRFNNPGARANGMGGAFIGLADDATAAYTNPAGYTHKPDHRIHYTGSLEGWKNWAPEGDDDNIFAVGLGAVFSEWLQIDGAASFGDFEKEYTVSLVYRY